MVGVTFAGVPTSLSGIGEEPLKRGFDVERPGTRAGAW